MLSLFLQASLPLSPLYHPCCLNLSILFTNITQTLVYFFLVCSPTIWGGGGRWLSAFPKKLYRGPTCLSFPLRKENFITSSLKNKTWDLYSDLLWRLNRSNRHIRVLQNLHPLFHRLLQKHPLQPLRQFSPPLSPFRSESPIFGKTPLPESPIPNNLHGHPRVKNRPSRCERCISGIPFLSICPFPKNSKACSHPRKESINWIRSINCPSGSVAC